MRNERRPAEESAAAKPLELFEVEPTAPRPPIAQEWDRRRAAEHRLPPLADGRCDPLRRGAENAAPAGGRTLHVEVGKRTAWLDGEKVFALLDQVNIHQRQWDHVRRLWMIPVQYADDAMAWAEWKQRRVVTCEAVD